MSEIHDQPMPHASDSPAMQDLVIADIEERKQIGLERYGQLLKAHDGRDALVDAYQEALDLTIYLRKVIYERDHMPKPAVGSPLSHRDAKREATWHYMETPGRALCGADYPNMKMTENIVSTSCRDCQNELIARRTGIQ